MTQSLVIGNPLIMYDAPPDSGDPNVPPGGMCASRLPRPAPAFAGPGQSLRNHRNIRIATKLILPPYLPHVMSDKQMVECVGSHWFIQSGSKHLATRFVVSSHSTPRPLAARRLVRAARSRACLHRPRGRLDDSRLDPACRWRARGGAAT